MYPKARTVKQVDDYHGTTVEDPYRWMEDLEDPDLKQWLDAQTALSDKVLKAAPCRDRFRSRLEELSRRSTLGIPTARGSHWFQRRNPGDLEQTALYVLDHPDDEGRILLDPRSLGEDVLVADTLPSPDGSLLMYGTTIGGSDWRTWRVMEVDTGRSLDDEVGPTKLWAHWLPDSSGFLYYFFPSTGEDVRRETSTPQLRMHKLGTSQEADELVYETSHYFFASVTDDGRYLVITPILTPKIEVLWCPIGDWKLTTLTTADDQMWFIGSRGDDLFFTTTHESPFGRVVAVRGNSKEWRTVAEETDHTLLPYASSIVGDWVVAVRDYLGASTVSMHALDGSDSYEVELPQPCRVVYDLTEPMGVSTDGTQMYFGITQPTSPSTLLRHDVTGRRTEVVQEPERVPNLEVVADVVWATSRDGTNVPMTLVRSASNDLEDPPVLIEGYGGGGDIQHPYDFSPWKLTWFEAGGVVGTAHVRGGRELGAEWESAAARGGKLKSMEDFIGCAEYLIEQRITTAEHVGITGRSSGGMLAAAAAVARPELFGSCVPEVGMFDPLRYHLFGLGRLMEAEYGTSENPEDFEAMYAYSPLHCIVDGTDYPATLITVHTDDDRVLPGSGFKFAATLQGAQTADAPILLLLRAGAGHFMGSVSGEIDERADILGFLAQTLKLPGCS